MTIFNDFYTRLYKAFGPIAGALILDFGDLVTFGPLGLVIGPVVGFAVGWWLASMASLDKDTRMVIAILAGAYMTIPFTEPLPLATLTGALGRFTNSGT